MQFKLALAAAALVGTASVASAADLGRPAPAAVDYVKVCDAYGAGFFYIPGSDTCLKIGGRVYFDMRTGSGAFSRLDHQLSNYSDRRRSGNNIFTRTAAYETFDARTNTEYGLLRSFINLRQRFSTGSAAAEIVLQDGFIQFGGLTAGMTRSAFDFTPLGYTFGVDYNAFQSNVILNQIGYTFAFGNGITATVSVEDPTSADINYNNSRRVASTGVFTALYAGQAAYGALKAPDVVGKLNIKQAWGSAQISAAYHDNYSLANGDRAGWAVLGGFEILLPMLAPGDKIAFGGAYGEGAQGFITAYSQYSTGNVRNVVVPGDYIGEDWAVDGFGRIQQTRSWGVMGSFHHEFNKKWEFNFDASYENVDGFGARDYATYGLQADVRWKPVSNFYIGVGAEYGSMEFSTATRTAHPLLQNVDGWTGLVRVNRTF
ncbi:porin [Methyloraptor flagellatus]|jgi:hypothetical protein|uniref:Porin n=1 Tax=Methyloraptor flagellatus TaxID=3162530 RepID=A0AAU7XID6_9HYPH